MSSPFALKPNATWFIDMLSPCRMLSNSELFRERLRSYFVINAINELDEDWRDFIHAVHSDIYHNFDEFEHRLFIEPDSFSMNKFVSIWEMVVLDLSMQLHYLPGPFLELIFQHM